MLQHCVFVNFRDEVSVDDRTRVLAGFGEIAEDVPGMLNYVWGPNRDFEAKSADYDAGFVITFTDRDAHLAYDRHPKHLVLGAELVSLCKGGADGIIVFDLETP